MNTILYYLHIGMFVPWYLLPRKEKDMASDPSIYEVRLETDWSDPECAWEHPIQRYRPERVLIRYTKIQRKWVPKDHNDGSGPFQILCAGGSPTGHMHSSSIYTNKTKAQKYADCLNKTKGDIK
jgi:hypothetical protein